jgi:hypothetical protein
MNRVMIDTLPITRFENLAAAAQQRVELDWEILEMGWERYPSKEQQPLLKLGYFGDNANENNCLRTNANMVAVTGAEIDYDDGFYGLEYAEERLAKAEIAACIYASSSHKPSYPKWRILLPFSQPFCGTEQEMDQYRRAAIYKALEALDIPEDKIDPRSFTLSQAFYFGVVDGADYQAIRTDGEYIDLKYNLKVAPAVSGSAAQSDGFTVGEGVDVEDAIEQILSGEHFHEPLLRLSARSAQQGMKPDDIKAMLCGYMKGSSERGSDRWKSHWKDISRMVKTAYLKYGTPISDRDKALSKIEGENISERLWRLCGVTQEKADAIGKGTYRFLKVVPAGQYMVLVGPPNGGKTAIAEYMAAHMSGRVTYINMDIPATHVPAAYAYANNGGYKLICPDMEPGVSIQDVITLLRAASNSDEDLSEDTFIIDTLKKITDVMSKSESMGMYKMLRALTGRGATVLCLAHTLKYQGGEGNDKWYAYEGVGDMRSDCDAMCLVEPSIGDYNLITASLYWSEQGWPYGKDRGIVEPASWTIDKYHDREVKLLDKWVDTHALNKEDIEVKQMADLIRDIHSTINGTPDGMNQTGIINALNGHHSARQICKALPRHEGKAWNVAFGPKNNELVYTAISGFKVWK